jgi:hypothetical protein
VISLQPEALRAVLWRLLCSSILNEDRPGYSNVEDVSASKVFIAASENALCGAHQKGNVFKEHMFDVYVA